jgi:hypothetical protein
LQNQEVRNDDADHDAVDADDADHDAVAIV